MTHGILTCSENDALGFAAQVMEDNKVRRLLVENDQGKVIGIISLGDLVVFLNKDIAGEVIKEVSQPLR